MNEKFTDIALLPLDNRPVSYLLPRQIANFSGIDLVLPERKYLGDLKHGSNFDFLEKWLNTTIETYGHTSLPLIISLDNWIYGGLVQSRKHTSKLHELKFRTDVIKNLKLKKYGFSSIMRIPSYDSSDEEKDLWKSSGKAIFNWSELMHRVGRGIKVEEKNEEELIENWYQSSKLIPSHILADFKNHRDINFAVNLEWLESLHKNCFEYLIFASDDSAKYGLNVVEAEYLQKEINKHQFNGKTKVISGTDEIPLVLMTKAILNLINIKPTLSLYFNSNSGKDLNARYESNSINNSVCDQMNTLGLDLTETNNSDLLVCIHLTDSLQGDHIFKNIPTNTRSNALKTIEHIKTNNKPFIIIDLAYANGADPVLVEELLKANIDWSKCYGYSGWNTCANSTGSALSIGINRWIAEKRDAFNETEFKKCLFTRFLDDYSYQTQIRHTNISELELNEKIKSHIETFSKLLKLKDIDVKCSLPWNRSFEVEITL